MNLSSGERLLSATVGTALVAFSLRRRPVARLACGMGGAALIYLALAAPASRPSELGSLDIVDEASRESFPASDAPGWIPAAVS